MKLMKNLRWAAIAIGIAGGSANALACVVTPDSILTEGQTLQLVADCGTDKVATINWKMAVTENGPASTITGDIVLNQGAAKKIYYTIPAELSNSGAGEYWFSVTGTSVGGTDGDISTADKAKVVIKPASAVLSVAQVTNPAVNGTCGNNPLIALQSMPTGTAQCSAGKAALAISGPTSLTWSCLGLNGGTEANCYGVRGYTVTTSAGANGSISSSQPVAAGGTATITAFPSTTAYSASFATGTTCPGTASGNTFAAGPISTNCTVNATFTNSPSAAVCGSASGVATLTAPSTNLCTTGTLLGSVVDGTGQFTWTCDGPNGGTDASCAAPKQYTVTAALSGTGGTVNTPTSKTVTHNATTSFTVTPEGTNVPSAIGCGASVSGNTVTTGAITGACTVTVSFGPPTTGISCNGVTMPGTVTEVDTSLPVGTVPRVTNLSAPVDTVYSYKVTVPTGTALDSFSAKVIKATAAPGTRYMVISECRGDYITANKTTGCYRMPSEVATATAAINYSLTVAPDSKYCRLEPGKTYWVNLSTRNSATGSPMCGSATECGFYFEAN